MQKERKCIKFKTYVGGICFYHVKRKICEKRGCKWNLIKDLKFVAIEFSYLFFKYNVNLKKFTNETYVGKYYSKFYILKEFINKFLTGA